MLPAAKVWGWRKWCKIVKFDLFGFHWVRSVGCPLLYYPPARPNIGAAAPGDNFHRVYSKYDITVPSCEFHLQYLIDKARSEEKTCKQNQVGD